MERCGNCQNILPRTVDRCPVCGQAVVVEQPEPKAPVGTKGPVWGGGAALTRRSQPVPAPELKTREPEGEGPRTVSRATPSEVGDARKVLAASSRIEANIQIGPTAQHSLFSVGASVLAVLALIAGAIIGYPSDNVIAAATDLPTPSTLPLSDSNSFVIDATGVAEVASPSIVQLTLTGCGTRSKTHGFITENSLVVTNRTAALRDTTPTLTLSDGSEISGQVIGWSRELDIAVILPDGTVPAGLSWGSSRRLKVQGEVAVIESFLNQVTGRNARISEVATQDGLVVSFGFEDVSLRAGSVALNEFATILGVIDTSGRLIPAEEIRSVIGEYRVDPQNLSAECG
jgi:hypothetical protein